MTRKLCLLAASLVMAASAPAWSQPDRMGGRMSCGGYGMGQGMMEGHGMGHGMMGGYGMGPGMMGDCGPGYGGAGIPNLTNEQRNKIADIEKDARQKQWQLMEKMHSLHFQADGTLRDGKFDEQAARKHYEAMASLRKQMFENSLETRKRIDGLLTPEQREQMQGRRPSR